MGQCGQGHSTTPISRPRRVVGLDGVPVRQMSAGTSHSIVWTALPTDRYGMSKGFPNLRFDDQSSFNIPFLGGVSQTCTTLAPTFLC